jgi:hypothetical protein
LLTIQRDPENYCGLIELSEKEETSQTYVTNDGPIQSRLTGQGSVPRRKKNVIRKVMENSGEDPKC